MPRVTTLLPLRICPGASVMDGWLNEAVAPAGSPETLKLYVVAVLPVFCSVML